MTAPQQTTGTTPLVSVDDLHITFGSRGGNVEAVRGVSFDLAPGASLGIVGESGSGKSALALALLDLHRGSTARLTGQVRVDGHDVLTLPDDELRALRGPTAAMVFQDPLTSFDPYFTIGDQISEVYRAHHGGRRDAAMKQAVEALHRVGIPDASRRASAYPHEFSGGMRQRALIAMALACRPKLLIADEPTTALDVTVQAQILDLVAELREELGMGLILVTHDLGVVAGSVDDILVMKDGRVVERGEVGDILARPAHDYTRRLVSAVPRVDALSTARATAPDRPTEYVVDGASKSFGSRGGLWGRREQVDAVRGVSVTVEAGEALGIVGESGSGKSTLARLLVGLDDASGGRVELAGSAVTGLRGRRSKDLLRVQMVFQDPASSLNPRRTIGQSLMDPLVVNGTSTRDAEAKAKALLARVGIDLRRWSAYPHQLSGGQRQRVAIARALTLDPTVLICDEPVSSLDVTTQASILELLAELRDQLGLTLIFVAHDLAVVRQVCQRVAVMRAGEIVEAGPVDEVFDHPQHDYTKMLLASVPVLDPVLARKLRAERRAAG
jgi:peptide/nickel transport system ATP-binding protein